MMYNIHTGRGVPKRSNEEIVILASSLPRLQELGIPFVFTDQHAYAAGTNFYSEITDLDKIDWDLLESPPARSRECCTTWAFFSMARPATPSPSTKSEPIPSEQFLVTTYP